jgi:putative ABC transport system substrate-binding protein
VKRREFITLLGSAAAAWPLAARAQQVGKIYRIGFLGNDPTLPTQPAGQAFLDALRESGFVEGNNILVDWRFAEGRAERYADLATTLVRLQMDAIVTTSVPAARALKEATRSIPVVMMNVSDPLGSGLVKSLARPEGNITGLAGTFSPEVAAKRLQLLKDAIPQIARVAVLINPNANEASEQPVLEVAAQSLRLTLYAIAVRRDSEFAGTFDAITRDRPDALFVTNNGLFFTHRRLIMGLALKGGLPAMSTYREATEDGGLMSYSTNRPDLFRHAATYVGKILKGTKVADLPVEQPTKYELVINLKTARSLNLEIPRDLLLIADEVIE